MNTCLTLLSNTNGIFGVPIMTVIFSAIALGLIIVTLVVTGIVANVMKKRKKANEVKYVAPVSKSKIDGDDGIFVFRHRNKDNDTSKTEAVADSDSEETEKVEDSSDDSIPDESDKSSDDSNIDATDDVLPDDADNDAVFVASDDSSDDDLIEDEDVKGAIILQNLSNEQDVLDEAEYETEDFSDDDMDEYFAKKARMVAESKASVDDDVIDEDLIDEDSTEDSETEEVTAEVLEEPEEIEEVEEINEIEEVAEEVEELSDVEEIVQELDDDIDLIAPSVEHETDDVIILDNDEIETIEAVADETEEEPETVADEPKEIKPLVEEVPDDVDLNEEGLPVPPPQSIECPNCETILSYHVEGDFLYCTECYKRYRAPENYRIDYIRYAHYLEREDAKEKARLLEQKRIAEEAKKQAEVEYQEQLKLAEEEKAKAEEEYREQLRLAEEEKEKQRLELEEKLKQIENDKAKEIEQQKLVEDAKKQAEAEYQELLRQAESENERQRAELEEKLRKIEEEKNAQFAQISEESRKLEATRLATEAMLARLEAESLARQEAEKIAIEQNEKDDNPPEFITDLEAEIDPEDEELSIKQSKYKRSFKSRIIQSDDQVKTFYNEIRNELLSYNKMRCSEAWSGETYIAGRKTVAKLLLGGKTLCLYLSLNPSEFNPNTYHHKDKSASKKYVQTPMQLRIKSDLSMRRAISLIVVMMSDNELEKSNKYQRKDYIQTLGYRDDEALLAEGLIKLNVNAIEVVDKTLDEQDYELERAEQEKMPKNYREVKLVKKGQVGNISQSDIGKINKTKKAEPEEENPNASKTGKFSIIEHDGEFKFVLYAPNGKIIFESKAFKTRNGARNAIDSFRIAIADGQNSSLGIVDDEYIYTVKANMTYISAPFKTKVGASRALNLIKKTSAVANVEE